MFETPDTKTCRRCDRNLSAVRFSRDRRSRDGLQPWCKECQRDANRAYRQRLRERNLEREPAWDEPKHCPSCDVTKRGRDFHRNRVTKDGLHRTCRECAREGRRKAGGAERDRRRHYADYGLTLDELQEMLERQEGCCAICGVTFDDERVPNVDHCHDTGEVRGLLCHHCNTGIGLLGDDPDRLEEAVQYLR